MIGGMLRALRRKGLVKAGRDSYVISDHLVTVAAL
jgi:hypothetical protein